MLISQAGETFNHHTQAHTSRTSPVYLAAENGGAHIQRAPVAKNSALTEPETLAIHKELDGQPVGNVRQFLFANLYFVKNARQQRSGRGFWIAFFKRAARAKVAVADGVQRF